MSTNSFTVTGYIYLNDVPDWHAAHPEALRRLREQAPQGAYWTTAGNDGGWWEAVVTVDCAAPAIEEARKS